jgi:hypothetical protein
MLGRQFTQWIRHPFEVITGPKWCNSTGNHRAAAGLCFAAMSVHQALAALALIIAATPIVRRIH